MMRKKGLFFIWLLSLTFLSKAQERGLTINEARLLGKWKYVYLDFKRPVDINRDGIKSSNGLDEYCAKLNTIEFFDDFTAIFAQDSARGTCKLEEPAYYTWEVVKKKVGIVSYKNDERVEKTKKMKVILLKHKEYTFEYKELYVKKWGKGILVVHDLVNDGTDSTSDCLVTMRKMEGIKMNISSK